MKIVQITAPTRAKYPNMKAQWDRGRGVTKEILSEMYLFQKMSSVDIGKYFGVTPQTVCNKMKAFGIQRRPYHAQLEGKKFGRWTVIRQIRNDSKGCARWLCKCECGNFGTPKTSILKNGMSKSCGCLKSDSAKSRSGKNHPSYKNGRTYKDGYVFIIDRSHPNANKRGRVSEHVYVMSKHIGRPILDGETIHHKNGIRDDNRIENLELRSGKHGAGVAVSDMVNFCVEYLQEYAPEKLKR